MLNFIKSQKLLVIGLCINAIIAGVGFTVSYIVKERTQANYSEALKLIDLEFIQNISYKDFKNLKLVRETLDSQGVEEQGIQTVINRFEIIDDALETNLEQEQARFNIFLNEVAGTTQTLYKELYNAHPLVSESMNDTFLMMKKFLSFKSLEAKFDAFNDYKSSLASLILKYGHHPLKESDKSTKIKTMLNTLHDRTIQGNDFIKTRVERVKISYDIKNSFTVLVNQLRAKYENIQLVTAIIATYFFISIAAFSSFILYSLFSKTFRIESRLSKENELNEDLMESMLEACENVQIGNDTSAMELANFPDEFQSLLLRNSYNEMVSKLMLDRSPNPIIIVSADDEVLWYNTQFSKLDIGKFVNDINDWNAILETAIIKPEGEKTLSKHIKFRTRLDSDYSLHSAIQTINGEDYRLISFLPLSEVSLQKIKSDSKQANQAIFDFTEVLNDVVDNKISLHNSGTQLGVNYKVNNQAPVLLERNEDLADKNIRESIEEIITGLTIYSRSIKNKSLIQINHFIDGNEVQVDFLIKGVNFDQSRIMAPIVIKDHQYPSLETYLNNAEKLIATLTPQIQIKNRIGKNNYQVMAILKLSFINGGHQRIEKTSFVNKNISRQQI